MDQDINFELLSALQKDIRRGNEVMAVRWAFDLERRGWMRALQNRLLVIAHEDIGLASMTTVTFVETSMNTLERFYPRNSAWRLVLTNIVCALARAPKSRDGDNIQIIAQYDLATRDRPIPDYALDKHTVRGRKMGRGMDHFLREGALLDKDQSNQYYKEFAEQLFRALDRGEWSPDGKPKDFKPQPPSSSNGHATLEAYSDDHRKEKDIGLEAIPQKSQKNLGI